MVKLSGHSCNKVDDVVQYFSISSVLAMDILQSCTQTSKCASVLSFTCCTWTSVLLRYKECISNNNDSNNNKVLSLSLERLNLYIEPDHRPANCMLTPSDISLGQPYAMANSFDPVDSKHCHRQTRWCPITDMVVITIIKMPLFLNKCISWYYIWNYILTK